MNIKRFNQLFENIQDKFQTDEEGNVTLNVTISNIDSSTAKDFLKMFKFMEWCGSAGTGRTFKAYLDGDGHFRPKFKIDGFDLHKDINFSKDDANFEDDEFNLDIGA